MLAHGKMVVVAWSLGEKKNEHNENWIFSSTHFPKWRK
jgi:hypothetical protein